MQLHDLRPAPGSHRPAKRVGRGTGSGRGKTSSRGQKGQKARGQGFRIGFEGGQMPLAQRLPKLPGFKNRFSRKFAVINLTALSRFTDGTRVTPELLVESGLVSSVNDEVKLLGAGSLRRRLMLEVHAVSAAATAAIEARGGNVKLLPSKQRVSAGTRRRAAATSPTDS